MRKLLILGFLISLSLNTLFAQERGANLSLKEDNFNFGSVKEENGPISHVFEFVNTGGSPLIIQNVQASCGCTTPDWTRKPIPPGGKGIVKATFNPSGRPGMFAKTITIISNALGKPMQVVRISGTVIPKPLGPFQQYPFPVGDLRFRSRHLMFGTLYPGMVKTDSVQFINAGDKNVTVEFKNLPSFLKAVADPTVVKPQHTGYLRVTYIAANRHDWDFLVDYMPLTLNGKQEPQYKITITANIEEDFTKLSPSQLAKAPKIEFEKNYYDFGTVKDGKKITFTFKYKNIGKSNLILRKIQTSCNCTTVTSLQKIVKPGAYGILRVNFNTQGENGPQNKAITLTTNDPFNRMMLIYIRGNVD